MGHALHCRPLARFLRQFLFFRRRPLGHSISRGLPVGLVVGAGVSLRLLLVMGGFVVAGSFSECSLGFALQR